MEEAGISLIAYSERSPKDSVEREVSAWAKAHPTKYINVISKLGENIKDKPVSIARSQMRRKGLAKPGNGY